MISGVCGEWWISAVEAAWVEMCVLSCGEGIAVNPKGVCQSVVPPRPLVSEQLQMAANGCFMSATAKNGEGTVEVHRLRKYTMVYGLPAATLPQLQRQ